jgi:hypothetical protein
MLKRQLTRIFSQADHQEDIQYAIPYTIPTAIPYNTIPNAIPVAQIINKKNVTTTIHDALPYVETKQVEPVTIFKTELNKKCYKNILKYIDVKNFLYYIKNFINSFILNKLITERLNKYSLFEELKEKINNFDEIIIQCLLNSILNFIKRSAIHTNLPTLHPKRRNNEYLYSYAEENFQYKYDKNITINVSLEIRNIILYLKDLSIKLINLTDKEIFYIHHICIILRRILIDLLNIINEQRVVLEYIPIEYLEPFIHKIHFVSECPKITGGINKSNYKKTENKITVIYKKKKYTRVIYISERKKYVKINKTYMLLSKLKKDIK